MIALLLPLIDRFRGVLFAFMLVGLCLAYWQWSRAEMAGLRAKVQSVRLQADALAAEDAALRADMQRVQTQVERANAAIADARSRALAATQAIRSRPLADDARRDPKLVQKQINDETAATFKSFEETTRR